MGYEVKSKSDLCYMRDSGQVVAAGLEVLCSAAVAGTALSEIDKIARDIIARAGATSSFLGYRAGSSPPFPGVVCTSVNDVVVHGLPGSVRLREGDIVSIDFGVILRGFHADAARTVGVGKVSVERTRLIKATSDALSIAISCLSTSNRVGDIGNAVQTHVESCGYSVVRDFVGHGIGRRMHEEPQVPNYGPPGRLARLRQGMVLALEPMVNAGGWDVELLSDGWTVRTIDRSDSAHFEDTVALTDAGPEILTRVQ